MVMFKQWLKFNAKKIKSFTGKAIFIKSFLFQSSNMARFNIFFVVMLMIISATWAEILFNVKSFNSTRNVPRSENSAPKPRWGCPGILGLDDTIPGGYEMNITAPAPYYIICYHCENDCRLFLGGVGTRMVGLQCFTPYGCPVKAYRNNADGKSMLSGTILGIISLVVLKNWF